MKTDHRRLQARVALLIGAKASIAKPQKTVPILMTLKKRSPTHRVNKKTSILQKKLNTQTRRFKKYMEVSQLTRVDQ